MTDISEDSSEDGQALPDPTDRSGQELAGFLHAHRVFLDAVIEQRSWFGKAQQAQVAQAWIEAQGSMFRAVMEIAGKSDDELAGVGLSGDQLKLKLDLWRRELHPVGSRLRRRWVRRTLKAANIIVGSVAGVAGVAEPVKELGEVIGNAIERRAGRG